MTPEETDLARRVVALEGWRWAPGMLARTREGMVLRILGRPNGGATRPAWTDLPDLHDPATAGVLLGMLWAAVPHWPVEVLMLRAHVEVCVGSPGSGGRTVHVGSVLGVAVARALVTIGRCA